LSEERVKQVQVGLIIGLILHFHTEEPLMEHYLATLSITRAIFFEHTFPQIKDYFCSQERHFPDFKRQVL
jgi:hypothetical protein